MNMYKRLSRLSPCKECVFVCVCECVWEHKRLENTQGHSLLQLVPQPPHPPAVNTPAALSLWTFSAEKAGGRCFFFFFFWKVTIRSVSGHCRHCLDWIEASHWCTGKFPKTKNKAYFVLMAKHQLWRNWLVWKHQYDETIKKKNISDSEPLKLNRTTRGKGGPV